MWLRRKGIFSQNGPTLTSSDLGGQIKWAALSANRWIHSSGKCNIKCHGFSCATLNHVLAPQIGTQSWKIWEPPALEHKPYNWHCMRKYVLAPLTVGCLNFNDMSSVFFYSASGGKMVTYHSSGLHVSAPAFISRGIASSNIQCRSQFVFSAKMTILLSIPIAHLWSVLT